MSAVEVPAFAPAPETAIAVVVQAYRIKPAMIRGKHGSASVALARLVAVYLAHEVCELSERQLAEFFHRDRSTINSALRSLKRRMAADAVLAKRVAFLKDAILGEMHA